MKEEINTAKLIEAIGTEWTTAADIKRIQQLRATTKKIGKEMAIIAMNNPTIEARKHKGLWQYRIKATPKQAIEPQTQEQPTKIENIITNLEGLGMDIKEIKAIIAKTLLDTQTHLEDELRLVADKAPTFRRQYDSMTLKIHQMENQIADMKDAMNTNNMKKMVDNISKERKLQKGIL